MRGALAGLMLLAAGSTAMAQDAAPDLKGVWSGPFRSVIFGNNVWHPGAETVESAPRVRDVTAQLEVEGQDASLLWGHSWSDPARKEPFAATIMSDGTSILGADTDGGFNASLTEPDRMEFCYLQTSLGPAEAIGAACGILERQP